MSDARPFRFGLAVTGDVSSREEWIGLARRAEDLGYVTLLVADHYVNEYPPIAALMAAADATSTLRVGSYVFNNDFRHPVQLAKEVAALDRLSVGALNWAWEPDGTGQNMTRWALLSRALVSASGA